MAKISVKSLLLWAKELSDSEIKTLESLLVKEKFSELKVIVKDLQIHLTGPTQKQDIIQRLIYMAHNESLQEDEGTDSDDVGAISYLIDETKEGILSCLTVTKWEKKLAGSLVEFTFINLLICLVWRDKKFEMQSMKAFRSLEA